MAYPSGAHCICLVYLSGLRSHAICMHLLLPNKNCYKLLLTVGMNWFPFSSSYFQAYFLLFPLKIHLPILISWGDIKLYTCT